MYSRKSVGPEMESYGTPALTGCSHQNHLKPSITEKRQNKAKYLSQNFIRLKFVKKTSMPNPVENLGGYTKSCSSSNPKPIKSLSNSIKTVKIFAVDRDDWLIKRHWKSEKRPHFSSWSTILLFTSFSKTLLTTERRLTGRKFLAVHHS